MNKNNRIVIYDIIRAICIIFVVLGHSTDINIGTNNPFNYPQLDFVNQVLQGVFRVIYFFHMYLFVMLSGACSIISRRKEEFPQYVAKRSKRLLLPYFAVGLLVWIPIRYLTGYYTDESVMGVILNDLILGKDINYLWFLMMTWEIGIIFYFIKKVETKSNRPFKVLLLLFLLIISFVGRRYTDLPFQISKTLSHLVWFYLGILFERNRQYILSYMQVKKNSVLLSLSLIISVVLYSVLSQLDTRLGGMGGFLLKFFRVLFQYYSVLCIGLVFAVAASKLGPNSKITEYLRIISNDSMIIYLYHVPVIYIFCWIVISIVGGKLISPTLYAALIILEFIAGLFIPLFIAKMWRTVRRGKE